MLERGEERREREKSKKEIYLAWGKAQAENWQQSSSTIPWAHGCPWASLRPLFRLLSTTTILWPQSFYDFPVVGGQGLVKEWLFSSHLPKHVQLLRAVSFIEDRNSTKEAAGRSRLWIGTLHECSSHIFVWRCSFHTTAYSTVALHSLCVAQR